MDKQELSARVAAEVFGGFVELVQVTPRRAEWRWFPPDWSLEQAKKHHPEESDTMLKVAFSQSVPGYAEHADDAVFVVETLAKRGFWMKLKYKFTEDYGCWVNFDPQGVADANPLYRGHGETIPEAICNAALAVVRNEITSRPDWE